MKCTIRNVCVMVAIFSVFHFASSQKFPKDKNGDTIYPELMYMQDARGRLRLENLTQEAADNILPTVVVEEDIILFLHTRSNVHNVTKLGVNDLHVLRQSSFDQNKRTMFVVHGWTADCEYDGVSIIRRAALSASDMNVFCVDWSKHANGLYVHTAKASIPEVGRFLSVFLNRIIYEMNVRPEDVTLVGHSLGAHVVGRAGALMNKKCHIVGLDPAGPMFQMWNYNGRIDKADGSYVQILHTNAGFLGYDGDMGHADFYANDGAKQPGCGLKLMPTAIIACSHERAPIYYAESLNGGAFRSVSCNGTYADFKRGKCAGNPSAVMGGLLLDENTRGRYYFKTYDEYPFSQG